MYFKKATSVVRSFATALPSVAHFKFELDVLPLLSGYLLEIQTEVKAALYAAIFRWSGFQS